MTDDRPATGPDVRPDARPDGPSVQLPPDPDAYDSPRARIARERGLASPYIPGGTDPEPDAGRREERYYLRILLVMIAVVVLGAFLLGVVENLIGG